MLIRKLEWHSNQCRLKKAKDKFQYPIKKQHNNYLPPNRIVQLLLPTPPGEQPYNIIVELILDVYEKIYFWFFLIILYYQFLCV